jgi:hypothetical protein
MKRKPMFNFNITQNQESMIYIVLPDIYEVTFDIIKVTSEFLNKFENITYVCSPYEYTFLKLLLTKSKTFSEYKRRISVELSHPIKLREIQSEECIVLYLNKTPITIENHKKAILCQLSGESDVVFSEDEKLEKYDCIPYLKKLLGFVGVKEEMSFSTLELTKEEIIKTSAITGSVKKNDYYVIFVSDLISSHKLSSFFKKNKLKKHLVIISKRSINIDDPKAQTFKDYDLLDFLAMQLQAKSSSCPTTQETRKIMTNLKVQLPLFNTYKEQSQLLFDITEPK